MNIAIVDDMGFEHERLSKLLREYEAMQPYTIHIKTFHSGTELLSNYTPGDFDVIFLDIFMGNENGVDCALELRQVDTDVNIIFLTSSSSFGVKSYDVRAVDYIIKPATLEALSRALCYCKFSQSQDEPTITVSANNQPLEINLKHILYADFQNRTAYIHLENCLLPVAGSFTKLSAQLTAFPQFMPCFKGIVVNLKQVQEVYDDVILLKNGESLPVSRRLKKQVQQRRLNLSAGSLREE